MRRIYHHLELQRLTQETKLHWLRRARALIRNLQDFEEYLKENGRYAYLVHIYSSGLGLNMYDIKKALRKTSDTLVAG